LKFTNIPFLQKSSGCWGSSGIAQRKTATTTAELINKIDTITDESRTVKEGFSKNIEEV
jgi:hypothetical protein